jgi:hypothetical protein
MNGNVYVKLSGAYHAVYFYSLPRMFVILCLTMRYSINAGVLSLQS